MFQIILKRANKSLIKISEDESVSNIYIVEENLPVWGVFEKLTQVRLLSIEHLRFSTYLKFIKNLK